MDSWEGGAPFLTGLTVLRMLAMETAAIFSVLVTSALPGWYPSRRDHKYSGTETDECGARSWLIRKGDFVFVFSTATAEVEMVLYQRRIPSDQEERPVRFSLLLHTLSRHKSTDHRSAWPLPGNGLAGGALSQQHL